jgi:hypothetical protein
MARLLRSNQFKRLFWGLLHKPRHNFLACHKCRKHFHERFTPGKDGWYWIRCSDQHGLIHREKGSPLLEGAKAALEKRRTEVREGKFFPEKVKQHSILFAELAKDYLKLVNGRKRSWKGCVLEFLLLLV